eukprot:8065756-Lingulodinium_polyedra.AAC.1
MLTTSVSPRGPALRARNPFGGPGCRSSRSVSADWPKRTIQSMMPACRSPSTTAPMGACSRIQLWACPRE